MCGISNWNDHNICGCGSAGKLQELSTDSGRNSRESRACEVRKMISRESLERRNKALQERILKLEKLNRELSEMHHEAQVKIQHLESENAYMRSLHEG